VLGLRKRTLEWGSSAGAPPLRPLELSLAVFSQAAGFPAQMIFISDVLQKCSLQKDLEVPASGSAGGFIS
jgi:hypothetical protein